MRPKFVKTAAVCAALTLWSGSVFAEICVNSTDDAFMELTSSSASTTITCYDAGNDENPPHNIPTEVGAGVFNDGILQVPSANLLTLGSGDLFDVQSGSLTSGLTGSFILNATGSVGLLFKTGQGQNTPDWWFFLVEGLTGGEVLTWTIDGIHPVNELSHVDAFIPLPPAVWLLGSGLVALFGIGRRRSSKVEPVAV
jgi:hypothetical protein